MKKYLFLFLVALMMPFALSAQQDARRRGDSEADAPRHQFNFEEYLNRKCDAVVRELGLSSQDSMRFVPVYRDLQKQKAQLFRKYGGARHMRNRIERGEQLPDTTLMRVVTNMSKLQAEDAQLELRFVEKFAQVLTPMQIYKLQLAEQKFKTDMVKRSKPARK